MVQQGGDSVAKVSGPVVARCAGLAYARARSESWLVVCGDSGACSLQSHEPGPSSIGMPCRLFSHRGLSRESPDHHATVFLRASLRAHRRPLEGGARAGGGGGEVKVEVEVEEARPLRRDSPP